MGLDGFSMGNLGLNADLTSAQMAAQAQQLAQKESEIKIKDVTESEKNELVKRKEKEPDEDQQFSDGFREKKEDEQEQDDNGQLSLLSENDFVNKDPSEFSVRINNDTEMIELFSNKDEKILETISATDLMSLISKLNSASGILINRKI